MVDGAGGFLTAFKVAMSVGKDEEDENDVGDAEIDANYAAYRKKHGIQSSPPGVATYGDGHGHFYDNNGDEVDGSTGSQWLRDNNGGSQRRGLSSWGR